MKDEKREPNHLVTICNQIYLPPQNLFPPSSSNLLKHPLHLSKASIPVVFFFGTSGRSDRIVVSLHTLQPTIDVTDVSYTCYTWGSPSKRVNSRLASSDYRKGMSILVVAPHGFHKKFWPGWKCLEIVGWLNGGLVESGRGHYCIEMGPIFFVRSKLMQDVWGQFFLLDFPKIIVHCVWGWCHIMTPELGGYGCDNPDLSWSWAPKDQDHAWCYELDPHDSSGGVDDWSIGKWEWKWRKVMMFCFWRAQMKQLIWYYWNDTVDGRNPVNQLRLAVYPIIYLQFFYFTSQVAGGQLDFFHQQYGSLWCHFIRFSQHQSLGVRLFLSRASFHSLPMFVWFGTGEPDISCVDPLPKKRVLQPLIQIQRFYHVRWETPAETGSKIRDESWGFDHWSPMNTWDTRMVSQALVPLRSAHMRGASGLRVVQVDKVANRLEKWWNFQPVML